MQEIKRPGKAEWAGRRRPMTRQSGYSVAAAVRLKSVTVESVQVKAGDLLVIRAGIPDVRPGSRVGFGGWFLSSAPVTIQIEGAVPHVLVSDGGPNVWRKFGSQWVADQAGKVLVEFTIQASAAADLAVYDVEAGHVAHEAIDDARPELLGNMWRFAPEGNFYPRQDGEVEAIEPSGAKLGEPVALTLKSCNRCGRYLPVNRQPHERVTLSFSNHCVAGAPCTHSSFGRIADAEDENQVHHMYHGFQLECRFCKKFFVNAALNPQRTAGQMKEDAARRRAFEVLLEHLYEGSPQLAYKTITGRDLAADVYERFGGVCFKCNRTFGSDREMNLDHTRPLALLWPLDEHATALCSDCNSDKRARPPSVYYTDAELTELAGITNLSVEELRDPSPNVAAIQLLWQKLGWFFDEFIPSGELDKVREGKATAALLIRALQKAIDQVPGGPPYDLVAEGKRRGIE